MNPELRKTSDAARCLPPAQPTILLVEDEPAVREVTREVLEMGGYRVLEAGSPDDACHIAEDQSAVIDLLLTDVVMPRMNGPELARQVSQSRPGLITIFMTGYTESEIPRTARRGALSNHIQKPFTIDGLLSRVGEALTARWRSSEDDNRPPQLSSP
jgi:CheY-like chemotaxis protein